jgi:hypothetical protein
VGDEYLGVKKCNSHPTKNKCMLMESSHEFQRIVHSLRTSTSHCPPKDQVCHISYVIKRAAKMVQLAKTEFNISKAMHQEIEFFCKKLHPDSGILLGTPISHIILQIPIFTFFGDSCLKGSGGSSISFGFR